MNIDPRSISVKKWCDAMVIELASLGAVPILHNPALWREWARVVVEFPGVSKFGPPRPDSFNDFQSWAIRFNQAVVL